MLEGLSSSRCWAAGLTAGSLSCWAGQQEFVMVRAALTGWNAVKDAYQEHGLEFHSSATVNDQHAHHHACPSALKICSSSMCSPC